MPESTGEITPTVTTQTRPELPQPPGSLTVGYQTDSEERHPVTDYEFLNRVTIMPIDELDDIDECSDVADLPQPQGEYAHQVPLNTEVSRMQFTCPCCREETVVRGFYPILKNELFKAPCCDAKFNLNPDITLLSFTIADPVASRRKRYEQTMAELDRKKHPLPGERPWCQSERLEHRNEVLRRQGQSTAFVEDIKSSFTLSSPPSTADKSLSRLHNVDLYLMWSLLSISSYPAALGVGADSTAATIIMVTALFFTMFTLAYDVWMVHKEIDESEYDISLTDAVVLSPEQLEPITLRIASHLFQRQTNRSN